MNRFWKVGAGDLRRAGPSQKKRTGPRLQMPNRGLSNLSVRLTGFFKTYREKLRHRSLSQLPLFRANVLQAFGQAINIDPTSLQERVEFFFGNSDRATARAESNVRKTPLGTQEVNQRLGATEAAGRFSYG